MLDTNQAKRAVEQAYPGTTAQVCVRYRNLFLVRVEQADPDEMNYDPFFSVDPSTGEVKEFSVLTDGNIEEIGRAFE